MTFLGTVPGSNQLTACSGQANSATQRRAVSYVMLFARGPNRIPAFAGMTQEAKRRLRTLTGIGKEVSLRAT